MSKNLSEILKAQANMTRDVTRGHCFLPVVDYHFLQGKFLSFAFGKKQFPADFFLSDLHVSVNQEPH